MKPLLPSAVSGATLGLCLYALLHAVNPRTEQEEPWVNHFRAADCEVHLRRTSDSLQEHIAVLEWRGQMGGDEFRGGRIVSIDLDRAPVQIVELPTAAAAEKLAAKERPPRVVVKHYGRFLMILSPIERKPVSRELVLKADRVFRERAERIP